MAAHGVPGGAVLDRPVDGGEARGLTGPVYVATLSAVLEQHTGAQVTVPD